MTDHRYDEIKEQKQQKTSLPSVYAVCPLADLVHYKSATFQKNGSTLPDSNKN